MTDEQKKVTNEELTDVAGGAVAPSPDMTGGTGGPGPIDGSKYQLPGNPGGMPSQDNADVSDSGNATR